MEGYVSVIIDIEESRKYNIEARNKIQITMIEYMKNLNRIFREYLEFEMVFSAGDEIQGLFRDIVSAMLFLRLFEILMQPVRIRAGIGIGEWNIKVKNGISTQQDGSTYHKAREAIEEVKKKQTQRFKINSGKNDDLLNNLINASNILKSQQGHMQNMAQTIMEFFYPFEEKWNIGYEKKDIKKIINTKWNYDVRPSISLTPMMQPQKKEAISTEKFEMIEPIYIDGINFDVEELIIKKNMSSKIAEILNCKRQNADMLIKRGNVIAIRSMDYTALQYLKREYRLQFYV